MKAKLIDIVNDMHQARHIPAAFLKMVNLQDRVK